MLPFCGAGRTIRIPALEFDPEAQLDPAAAARAIRGDKLRRNDAKILQAAGEGKTSPARAKDWITVRHARVAVNDVVEKVEEVGGKVHMHALSDCRPFSKRSVQVPVTEPTERIRAAGAAVRCQQHGSEIIGHGERIAEQIQTRTFIRGITVGANAIRSSDAGVHPVVEAAGTDRGNSAAVESQRQCTAPDLGTFRRCEWLAANSREDPRVIPAFDHSLEK